MITLKKILDKKGINTFSNYKSSHILPYKLNNLFNLKLNRSVFFKK